MSVWGDRAELDRLRDPTEAVQWEIAARVLTLGVDVILDWGLWTRAEREELLLRVTALGASVRLHYCEATLDVLLERAIAREQRPTPGEFRIEERDLLAWWDMFEAPTEDELANYDGDNGDADVR